MARTTALAAMSLAYLPGRTRQGPFPSTDSGIVTRTSVDLDNRAHDFWAQQSPGPAPTRICPFGFGDHLIALFEPHGILAFRLPGLGEGGSKVLLYWQLLVIALLPG